MRAAPPQKNGENSNLSVSVVNPAFDGETIPLDEDGEVDVDKMNADQKWWKMLSGAKKRQTEIENFANRYFFNDDEKAKNRFLDKWTFMFAVLACLFMTLCISSEWGRALLPFYFCISCPILIVIRYFQYKKRKWHYFLLDFCYWANALCMLNLIAFPKSGLFFTIMFAITHAPLPWTIIAYRNSLVFHSIDKFSSFYIHMFPPALYYALRWYPEDCSRWWWTTFNTSGEGDVMNLLNLTSAPSEWILAIGMPVAVLVIFFVQQSFEIFLINVVAKHPCGRNWLHVYYDEEYQTLFRYSSTTGQGFVYNFINAGGPNWRLTMWMILNMIYTLLVSIPVYIWYKYQVANAVFNTFCFCWGTWNGANFYIEVFSRKYGDKRESVRRPPVEA